jgi:anti-anti-sigma factor
VNVIDYAALGAGDEPQGHVVLDLDGVRCLDQVVLRALLRLSNQVRAGGGEVSLSSLGTNVRRQAQKMRLHRILEVFNTPEEAFRTYSA